MCRLVFLLFITLIFTGIAAGRPVLSDTAIEVRIGVPNIPPFGYGDTQGQQVDWWREVARRADFRPVIRLFPLTRLRKALERGVIDGAIYGPGPKPQDGVVDLFVHQPVYFSFFTRYLSNSKNLELQGRVVGVVRGASGVGELSREYGFEVFPVSSYDIGLGMLNRGRLDALYGIENIINYTYRNSRDELAGFTLPKPVQVKTVLNKVRVSKAFAEKHPDIIAKIKSIGADLRREGFIEKTIDAHEK